MINSEDQYREILDRVHTLVSADPIPDSDDGRELGVLTVLVRDYERRAFPLAEPNPLAAIRLRMEQMGLAPRDLTPFLGARSKVSEVLAGKRPLSLAMIRALHAGLSIPLESLVAEQEEAQAAETIEWDRFPVRELLRRGWLHAKESTANRRIGFSESRSLMEDYFAPIGGPSMALGVLHRTDFVRASRSSDKFALAAWAGHVRRLSEQTRIQNEFRPNDWNAATLKELRSLSQYDVGPRLATKFLQDRGVIVIIAQHLKRTRLDGAAMLRSDGAPVIGMTLRHDRVDNFWFTLCHELMHVLLHLKNSSREFSNTLCFIDDLDVVSDVSEVEREADAAAGEALVPVADWNASAVRYAVAPATVVQLARELGVSEAIVAGRVRHERGNFRLLTSMLGSGQVRIHFPDVNWFTERN